MFIGHITGFIFLPVSIIIYLNVFGITKIDSILGMNILLVAAIGLFIVRAGEIMDTHFHGEKVITSYIIGLIITFPSLIYFLSKVITISPAIMLALPLIIGSFLFVEGMRSFFIVH